MFGGLRNTSLKRVLLQLSLILVVLYLLTFLPFWQRLEHVGFDLLSLMNASDPPVRNIVIVGIDEPSFAELDQQWPWPRSWHAKLVEQLVMSGAEVVGFDILFAEPSLTDDDNRFAHAIAEAGNVVLAKDKASVESAQFNQVMVIEPIPALYDSSLNTGYVGVSHDDDMIVRKTPSDPESLAIVIADEYLRIQQENVLDIAMEQSRMIRYYGPAQTFEYVSYYQVLKSSEYLPKNFFKGKIVLVGLNLRTSPNPDQSLTDQFGTPFLTTSNKLTPGVEIHATLLSNLLHGDSIRILSQGERLGLLGLCLFLATIGLWRWSPLRSALVVSLLLLIIAVCSNLLFERQVWWPCVLPVSGVLALYLSQGVFAFIEERQRKLAIKRSFSHYLAPQVVEQVLENPDLLHLGGTRRELTLMFTDLQGFTNLAEENTPEQVTEFLNTYLTRQTEIIHDNGGTVDKFIGDAVMAFWGAPLDCEDHASKACQAAREMRSSMVHLRKEFLDKGWPELYTRIGIHTGHATVGNMGSDKRFDYTAIGDDVNLAARLESINKFYQTDVLLSEVTARAVSDDFTLRFVDSVRVKGKSKPVDIFTFASNDFPLLIQDTAHSFYAKADWPAALSEWKKLLEVCPDDTIAQIFVKRIERFIKDGVSDNWDGIITLR